MQIEEHWRHVARREVVKTTGHLLDARKALRLAAEHAKLSRSTNDATEIIASNIDALSQGIDETVRACGIAADQIKRTMETPDAIPSPARGWMGPQLTPFQRMLAREGTVFETMPKYVATKIEQRLPKILNFTLKTPKKRKSRCRNKKDGNIPL